MLDGKSGFYGLYPLLAGAPLAAFGGRGAVVCWALQRCWWRSVVVVYP
jgi:hypothetical protein